MAGVSSLPPFAARGHFPFEDWHAIKVYPVYKKCIIAAVSDLHARFSTRFLRLPVLRRVGWQKDSRGTRYHRGLLRSRRCRATFLTYLFQLLLHRLILILKSGNFREQLSHNFIGIGRIYLWGLFRFFRLFRHCDGVFRGASGSGFASIPSVRQFLGQVERGITEEAERRWVHAPHIASGDGPPFVCDFAGPELLPAQHGGQHPVEVVGSHALVVARAIIRGVDGPTWIAAWNGHEPTAPRPIHGIG